MRKILILMLVMGITMVQAQTIQVSGIQSGTWDSDTVFVIGDVTVPVGSQLLVQAGTRVIFKNYNGIMVEGGFRAIGTASDSIYFTVADTTGFYNLTSGSGGWNGIHFQNCTDSIVISYCSFSYGKATERVPLGGAVRIFGVNRISINNCTFRHNLTTLRGGALYAEHSILYISNCEVAGNIGRNIDNGMYMHGAGFFFLNCEVNMSDMYFHHNVCPTCYGGGVNFDSCQVAFSRAVFEYNSTTNAAGIGVQRSSHRSVKMSDILLHHNKAYHYGGGMAISASSPEVNNFTIVNNSVVAGGGAAMQIYQVSEPVFTNCIIWGNTWTDEYPARIGTQIWIWNSESHPKFRYGIIEQGLEYINNYKEITEYDNMLDVDPMLIDTTTRNYALDAASPCVDAGTPNVSDLYLTDIDLIANPRISNGRIDMGAFELLQTSNHRPTIAGNAIKVYPNPLSSNSVCSFYLNKPSDVTVKIFSVQGALIWQQGFGLMQQGEHIVPLFDFVRGVANNRGVYFIRIYTGEQTLDSKILF